MNDNDLNNKDIILKYWLINHGPEIIYQVKYLYPSQDQLEAIFRILDSSISFSSKVIPFLLRTYDNDFIFLIQTYINEYYALSRDRTITPEDEKNLAIKVFEEFITKRQK